MITSPKSAVRFAAAAAAFAAFSGAAMTAPAHAADQNADTVHCYGVNSCKGQSACKSGNHACKGQNSCKGQGFKEMTTKACNDAGGSLKDSK